VRFLLVVVVLFIQSAAHAFELSRDSSGQPAGWKTPVHFVVEERLGALLDAEGAEGAVRAALKTYNDAFPALQLSASPGKPHGVGYDFDHPEASTSDVLVPAEWKWNVDAVATTVISISLATHAIVEADIAFNAAHTQFAVVGHDPRKARYDVQTAMTHELGHALGLAHSTVPGTVMFPSSAPDDVSKRALAADDLEALRTLYPPAPVVLPDDEPAVGCSATGSAPFALVALMMASLFRRRRGLVTLATVVGAILFVAPVFASAPAVERAWTVSAVATLAPTLGAAILESEVTFVREGLSHTVRVPGGRWGGIEQVVHGAFVPRVGEKMLGLGQ
jgi:uncharacterized protein (TIGR03382 family)